MAKALDTVWIDGLLYKLTLLKIPSYIVHTISSYLRDRTFEVSFQTTSSSRRSMRAEVDQGGLITPVLFRPYVNVILQYSHRVELAFHADGTAIISTSRKSTLLVSYLVSYLSELQRCLSEWKIAINISKSTAITFAHARWRFIQPTPTTLFGETIKWVGTIRYLGLSLDTRITWSPHIEQVRKRAAQKDG